MWFRVCLFGHLGVGERAGYVDDEVQGDRYSPSVSQYDVHFQVGVSIDDPPPRVAGLADRYNQFCGVFPRPVL